MYKQVIRFISVCVALGIAVGLLVTLSSNAFFNAQETTPLPSLDLPPENIANPADLQVQAANQVFPLFLQFVAQSQLDADLVAQNQSTSRYPSLDTLVPKALAQSECTNMESGILDQALGLLRDEFIAALAKLNGKMPGYVENGCFSIVPNVTTTVNLWKNKKDKSYAVTGSIEGTIKLFYYDKYCVIQTLTHTFDKNAIHTFIRVKGKLVSSDTPLGSDYEKTKCYKSLKYNTPMLAVCPRCPSKTPDEGSSGGIGGGL